ncbi:interleukin-4 receptor subunit alpha isoform X1 [Pogona vitticeps]
MKGERGFRLLYVFIPVNPRGGANPANPGFRLPRGHLLASSGSKALDFLWRENAPPGRGLVPRKSAILKGVPTNDVQPTCYTDYAAELACCWEAAPSANCTEAFLLRYQTDASGELQECLPKNVRGPGPGSWCTCAFPVASPFRIVLDRITTRNRTEVWQTKAENKVKPRPLVNLTVAKKSHSFLLTWKKDYVADSILHKTKANYEVAYWLQGQEEKLAKCPGKDGVCCSHWCRTLDTEPPCLAVRQASAEVSSGYEIYANQLAPHSNYMASVRYRLVLWETVWSEWSSPCTWYNDLELGDDEHRNDLLWVCVPVVAVILTCYICLGRVKKWQDSIPHPVILMGKQVPSPSFPKKERKPSPYGIKALLCDLCNQNGREFQGRRPPAPASGHTTTTTMTTMQENEPPAQQERVLWPEIPLIERLPVTCSFETGTEPQTQQEKVEGHRHVPHANAMASLFRDAVTGDLSPADTRGLELWPEGQEGPRCPRQPPPENVPQAPRLFPEWSLDVHSDRGGRATMEGSSEPGYHKTIMEEPAVAAAGPAPKQGLSCDPAASEVGFQSLLLPPESPSAPGGAAHLKSTSPCPNGQAGGLHPTPAHGYKSFSSLSQHMANFCEALEGQPSLPRGDQIQLLGSDGGGNQSLLLSPRVCGLNSLFPGCRDALPWLSSGKGAAATPLILTPLKEDSFEHIPVGRGTTPCPEALSPPGYRSLASLLQNGAGGMHPSSLGPESPYKPLHSVLRSGPTEPPPPLLLGPGLSEKASGIAAWPGVLWDATLGLRQQSDSVEEEEEEEEDFPGDRELPCI